MKQGDFTFVRHWLHKNIHELGKEYDIDALTKKVSGKALSEEIILPVSKEKKG
jgi:Zn-dependent M32 family carboxypeptidase